MTVQGPQSTRIAFAARAAGGAGAQEPAPWGAPRRPRSSSERTPNRLLGLTLLCVPLTTGCHSEGPDVLAELPGPRPARVREALSTYTRMQLTSGALSLTLLRDKSPFHLELPLTSGELQLAGPTLGASSGQLRFDLAHLRPVDAADEDVALLRRALSQTVQGSVPEELGGFQLLEMLGSGGERPLSGALTPSDRGTLARWRGLLQLHGVRAELVLDVRLHVARGGALESLDVESVRPTRIDLRTYALSAANPLVPSSPQDSETPPQWERLSAHGRLELRAHFRRTERSVTAPPTTPNSSRP